MENSTVLKDNASPTRRQLCTFLLEDLILCAFYATMFSIFLLTPFGLKDAELWSWVSLTSTFIVITAWDIRSTHSTKVIAKKLYDTRRAQFIFYWAVFLMFIFIAIGIETIVWAF